ncbi:MAG: helix-hairpin-helix domain-containing protein [Chitinophagaceae bacterium]|nr:helix-hairpin-helix domain-containing protein [Chitinophagaceae bacterium]
MKILSVIRHLVFHCIFPITFSLAYAQEIPGNSDQQLENLADVEETETEDDRWLQELEFLIKNPLNLNSADEDDLKQLRILTDLQIQSFLNYRKFFGPLLSLYELQAVPTWDPVTIKKLWPYISLSGASSGLKEITRRRKGGQHELLMRSSMILEKAEGYRRSGTSSGYYGSPQRMFIRYRYQFKNLMQYGFLGEKDAGEPFFRSPRKEGFDFYSFHFFLRNAGVLKSLALGDFTVNLGQGLIQWQSLAFKKSAEVMLVKRQSATLRPYNSAGEFNFHRGAGITLQKRNITATLFFSYRKLSANFVTDTLSGEEYVTSLLTSGFHRTKNELSDRNVQTQMTAGGNIGFKNSRFHFGINGVAYRFSLPIQKRDEPYNLYSLRGDDWMNFSADFGFTVRNLHLFGEAAIDKKGNAALLNGLMISADSRADLSVVFRKISPKFQSLYGNAFTENTLPVNETGLYLGATLRPAMKWRIDLYADFFSFPWLKYQTDAPGFGTDFFGQITFTPAKRIEIYTRYRNETKKSNWPGNTTVMNYTEFFPRQNWRTHINVRLNEKFSWRGRVEMVWFSNKNEFKETGFLIYNDILYKPMARPLSGSLRLQYFETDGYKSRIYAYENDVLYSFSIPPFYHKGYRYYLNLNYDLTRKLSLWLRWAQSIFENVNQIGSGLDKIRGNIKSEIKLQFRYIF